MTPAGDSTSSCIMKNLHNWKMATTLSNYNIEEPQYIKCVATNTKSHVVPTTADLLSEQDFYTKGEELEQNQTPLLLVGFTNDKSGKYIEPPTGKDVIEVTPQQIYPVVMLPAKQNRLHLRKLIGSNWQSKVYIKVPVDVSEVFFLPFLSHQPNPTLWTATCLSHSFLITDDPQQPPPPPPSPPQSPTIQNQESGKSETKTLTIGRQITAEAYKACRDPSKLTSLKTLLELLVPDIVSSKSPENNYRCFLVPVAYVTGPEIKIDPYILQLRQSLISQDQSLENFDASEFLLCTMVVQKAKTLWNLEVDLALVIQLRRAIIDSNVFIDERYFKMLFQFALSPIGVITSAHATIQLFANFELNSEAPPPVPHKEKDQRRTALLQTVLAQLHDIVEFFEEKVEDFKHDFSDLQSPESWEDLFNRYGRTSDLQTRKMILKYLTRWIYDRLTENDLPIVGQLRGIIKTLEEEIMNLSGGD